MPEIAQMAGRNDGVVRRSQLLEAGIGRGTIDRHLVRGNLVAVYRAVYSIGHATLSELGQLRAALLLAGEGACLSHVTAAQIYRLVDDTRFARPGIIHVTRREGGRSGIRRALVPRQPAARIHRAKGLRGDEVHTRRGLPVTSVERTLIDLAGDLTRRQLESAVLKAQRLRAFDPPRLARRLTDPMCGRKGIGTLRELVEAAVPAKARTLSEPEAWMLDLLSRHGVPEPHTNEPVEGICVDFHWPEARLIVEFDGHAFHSSRVAMRRDKRRDRALQLAGWTVLRYTYEDLVGAPEQVAAEIAEALRRGGLISK